MEKEKTGKLERMVDDLAGLKDKNEIVGKLQEINEFFLQNFNLKANGYVVEPIQTEVYYYNEKFFRDDNTHRKDKQRGHFGELYFHERGRGGVDIVLSNSKEFYLSLLLKTTKIGDNFFSQIDLKNMIKGKVGDDEVLVARDKARDEIVFKMIRKGLVKGSYKDEWLGAVIGIDVFRIPSNQNPIAFPKGGKEAVVLHYIDENKDVLTIEELEKRANYLGYNSTKVGDKIRELRQEKAKRG